MKSLRRSIDDGLTCLIVQHAPVSFIHMILKQISSNTSFYVDDMFYDLARLQQPTDSLTDTCKTVNFSITDHCLVTRVLRRMWHIFERNEDEITECTGPISACFDTGIVSISKGTGDQVIYDINDMVKEHKKSKGYTHS